MSLSDKCHDDLVEVKFVKSAVKELKEDFRNEKGKATCDQCYFKYEGLFTRRQISEIVNKRFGEKLI